MPMKESPILYSRADARLRYKKALAKAMSDMPNPYESEMHKAAKEWLREKQLKIRSLRNEK
jgi:hypothetical protein